MKLVPLYNRILVEKPAPADKVSKAGIILTEAPEPENIGKVLAIGDEVTEIKTGDMIVFPPYGATEITEDTTTYLIFEATDILAKRVK